MKRTIFVAITLLVCLLTTTIGGTIAWFTDEVASGVNVIQAGNLDVELEYWDGDSYEPVTTSTKLFNEAALWEPGYTEVAYLKVSNVGSLAFKYQLGVNVASEVSGKNKFGKDFMLSDYLNLKIMDSDTDLVGAITRESARAAAEGAEKLQTSYYVNDLPAANDAKYLALIICMPTTVDNNANHDGVNVPAITMGVKLEATQLVKESDSFGSDYDKYAKYDLVPGVPAEDTTALIKKLENASAGDTVEVLPGVYELSEPLKIPGGVTLKGAQAGVPASEWATSNTADMTVFKAASGNIINIHQEVNDSLNDIVIDGIMFDGLGTADSAIRTSKASGTLCLTGVEVVNCAVINSKEGIVLKNTSGARIENNYIEDVTNRAIALTNYFNFIENDAERVCANNTGYVCNNVINGVNANTEGAIMIENGQGPVVVSGNTLKNITGADSVGSSEVKSSAITVYDLYEGSSTTVENNIIENVVRGITVYKFTSVKYDYFDDSMTPDADKVIVRGNSIKNFTGYGIGTSYLHEKTSGDYYTVLETTEVEITGNDFNAEANALSIGSGKPNWKVTASGNTVNGAASDALNRVFTN